MRWAKGRGRYFLAVLCRCYHGDSAFDCTLGTIEYDADFSTADAIAPKVDALLEEYEISPRVCVSQIASRDITLLAALNRVRRLRELPDIQWFPCICDFINSITEAFVSAGSEIYAPLKGLELSLRRDSDFARLCTDSGAERRGISPSTGRWANLCDSVISIVDLKEQINTFMSRQDSEVPTLESMMTMAGDLKEILEALREMARLFEQDQIGNIAEIQPMIAGMATYLGTIEGAWRPAANAALAKLEQLEGDLNWALRPITMIAARLNPKYTPWVLRGATAAVDEKIEADIVQFAGQLQAQRIPQPVSPERTTRLPLDMRKVGQRESDASRPYKPEDAIKVQFSRFKADCDQREQDVSLPFEGTAVDFWNTKRKEMPELSQYALSILSQPVTCAQTYRQFEVPDRIAALRRLCLLTDNVDHLAVICTNGDISGDVIFPLE
jgi:hypothetical protein